MSLAQPLSTADFVPTSGNMGREVRGVDLSLPISEELVREIQLQLGHHGVLVFGDQSISESEQLDFTRRFGDTIGHPVPGIGGGDAERENEQEVFYLVNNPATPEEELRKPRRDGTLGWHTDLEYMPEPQVYSVLCAVEIPSSGGETEWSNLAAAYEALDDETKAEITNVQVVRWYVRAIPQVTHPAVRKHPITGQRSLYISPGLSRYVEGFDEERSDRLLERLFDHITQEQFCYIHTWKPGDVVMWDNRLTLHRRHGFDVTERRVVRRTQTAGEPVRV